MVKYGNIWVMIIRRPLALIFLAFMLGIGTNYIFSPPGFIYMIVIVICAGILFFMLIKGIRSNDLRRHLSFFTVILIIINIGGILCEKELTKEDQLAEYTGSEVTCRAIGEKYRKCGNDFHKLTVKNGTEKYLLYVSGEISSPEDYIGSELLFTGVAEKPSPKRNPGGYNYELYLKSVGIRSIISLKVENIKIKRHYSKSGTVSSFSGNLTRIKYRYLNDVEEIISQRSFGILNGMLFGSKDDIDDELYEIFQKNGIAHVLSVSGIHVGIVYAFVYALMSRRVTPVSALIIFFFLFIYAFLSEFSPSVIRAVLMISIHMAAVLLRRPYDLLTGTSLAALIMLIKNPLSLFHVGFQLSFLAVILLAFFIPFSKRYIGKKKIIGILKNRFKDTGDVSGGGGGGDVNASNIKIRILNSLLPVFIIQLGMAPFSVYVFNYFSFSGLILNIFIIFIAGIIIPIGICLIPLSMINAVIIRDFIFPTGARLLDTALSFIIKVNDVIFTTKLSSMTLVSPIPWTLLMFYGALFFFCSETFRILYHRKKRKTLISIVSSILIISYLGSFTPVLTRDNSEIVFVDVGQGDCIHVRTPGGKNILFDGGGNADYKVGKKILLPYLLKKGVDRLDYVFVTHLHTDHFQGIKELSNYMDTGRLVVYDGNRVNTDELTGDSHIKKEDIIYVGKGDRLRIEEGVYIDALYPCKKDIDSYLVDSGTSGDENDYCLVMRLDYRGLKILITGDLREEGERSLISEYIDPKERLKSTILKVGHHGSKYSTSQEFLDYVDPGVAVIQVGKNNFGHPTPEVIEKLNNKSIMIYRNDMDGAVLIDFKKEKLHTRKMIE